MIKLFVEQAIATVAQSVEQLIRNQQVAGSSPASSSRKHPPFRWVFFLFLFKRKTIYTTQYIPLPYYIIYTANPQQKRPYLYNPQLTVPYDCMRLQIPYTLY